MTDTQPDLRTPSGRLAFARESAGYSSARAAALAFGWNANTYKSHEFGLRQAGGLKEEQARKYARAFGVSMAWLLTGRGDPKGKGEDSTVKVIGRVGADPSGRVILSTADETHDVAAAPPGGTADSVALEVTGHSMRGFADNGALIYFEAQHTPPTPDMLGHVVVCQLDDGQVVLKRLLKGSSKGLYDLESLAGPTMEDQRIAWAAHITAIIPPHKARQILVRGGERAA